MALFLLAEKLCNLHFLVYKYTGVGLFFYFFRKYLMTLLVLQQTHPVTNLSVPISKARSPNFYRNIFRKFPLRWDQHFIKELMELLGHVHRTKTKPPCIYLNVDPVCDTSPPSHGGSFHMSYILDFTVSSLSELFGVPLDPCLTTALFAFLSQSVQLSELPVSLLLSVLSLNVLFKGTVESHSRLLAHTMDQRDLE